MVMVKYGLVAGAIFQGYVVQRADIFDTYEEAKWEWLEMQAARFRAGMGLDDDMQVMRICLCQDGTCVVAENDMPVEIIEDEDLDRQAA